MIFMTYLTRTVGEELDMHGFTAKFKFSLPAPFELPTPDFETFTYHFQCYVELKQVHVTL